MTRSRSAAARSAGLGVATSRARIAIVGGNCVVLVETSARSVRSIAESPRRRSSRTGAAAGPRVTCASDGARGTGVSGSRGPAGASLLFAARGGRWRRLEGKSPGGSAAGALPAGAAVRLSRDVPTGTCSTGGRGTASGGPAGRPAARRRGFSTRAACLTVPHCASPSHHASPGTPSHHASHCLTVGEPGDRAAVKILRSEALRCPRPERSAECRVQLGDSVR